MATKTLLTIDGYNALEEPAGVRYELDRGELVVTPSPMPRHNIICGELVGHLNLCAKKYDLGEVLYEVDVLLARAGVQTVWVMYPKTRQAYRYVQGSLQPSVLDAERGDKLEEPRLLPGFSLLLSEILP